MKRVQWYKNIFVLPEQKSDSHFLLHSFPWKCHVQGRRRCSMHQFNSCETRGGRPYFNPPTRSRKPLDLPPFPAFLMLIYEVLTCVVTNSWVTYHGYGDVVGLYADVEGVHGSEGKAEDGEGNQGYDEAKLQSLRKNHLSFRYLAPARRLGIWKLGFAWSAPIYRKENAQSEWGVERGWWWRRDRDCKL